MIHLLTDVEPTTAYSERTLAELGVACSLMHLVGAAEVGIFVVQAAGTATLLERITHASSSEVSFRDSDFQLPESSIKLESRPEMETCVVGEQIVACDDDEGGLVVHCLPVAFDGKVAAVVELLCDRMLTAEELETVGAMIGYYRALLSRLDDAERDPLSGLLNRNSFDRKLERILATMAPAADTHADNPDRRASPDIATPHWLAVIDIDHFKRVNDKFGQLYGDEVLILLANLMRESFRHQDRLFRFDGEAMVVVMRPASFEDASRALERFRMRVAAQHFPQVGEINVSIGLAAIASGDTVEDVLAAADEALRYAKSHGRNQLACYEKLVAAGEIRKRAPGDVDIF